MNLIVISKASRIENREWMGFEFEATLNLSDLSFISRLFSIKPLCSIIYEYWNGKNTLKFGAVIDTFQSCCEEPGYFIQSSNDLPYQSWPKMWSSPKRRQQEDEWIAQLVGHSIVSIKWGKDIKSTNSEQEYEKDKYINGATINLITQPPQLPQSPSHQVIQTKSNRRLVVVKKRKFEPDYVPVPIVTKFVLFNFHNGYYPRRIALIRNSYYDEQKI